MSHRALARLAPTLARQFGVVTTAQARDHGVDGDALTRLRRAGALEPCYRGVWRCRLLPDSWEARLQAAVLAAGPQAVVGRWSAARLLGLVRPRAATTIDLVVPRARSRRRSGPPIRTSRRLRAEDVTVVGGFRCGSVAWTLGELAAVAAPPTVERIAARAIAEGRCQLADLERLAARLHDVPGVRALRGLLPAASQVVVGARSRAESRYVRSVLAAGLPRPMVNLAERDAAGALRYLDVAWPAYLVAVELDVHPGHATTIGRRLDGRRQNDLVPRWTMLRFDASDLDHRPQQVVAQTRRVLLAAGWDGATGR
jgi:hypothetical protein